MPLTRTEGEALVYYLERDRPVGQRRVYCCGYRGGDDLPRSAYWPNTAYFCPTCGELWARAIYAFEFDYDPIPQAAWTIERRHCAKHGDGQLLYAQESLEHCSEDLLLREFLALLENHK